MPIPSDETLTTSPVTIWLSPVDGKVIVIATSWPTENCRAVLINAPLELMLLIGAIKTLSVVLQAAVGWVASLNRFRPHCRPSVRLICVFSGECLAIPENPLWYRERSNGPIEYATRYLSYPATDMRSCRRGRTARAIGL